MSWPIVPLGEFCNPKQHPTLSGSDLIEDGYPVYSANGKIGFFNIFTHQEPVILIGCRGSCGTVHITDLVRTQMATPWRLMASMKVEWNGGI